MPSREWQRAVLAARQQIAAGRRILVSSRAFWQQFDLNILAQDRRDIIKQARELNALADEIERGSIQGELAWAMTDAGFPTTAEQGGLTGGPQATIFAKLQYTDTSGSTVYKTVKMPLAWGASIDELSMGLDAMISDIGDNYGIESGSVVSGSLVIY